MNHSYSVFERIFGRLKIDQFIVEEEAAFVFGINTKKTLHHRRFSGAVFSHQTDYRTSFNRETDIFQYLVFGKRL